MVEGVSWGYAPEGAPPRRHMEPISEATRRRAQARFGASIFWMRPALLIGETAEQFIVYWQIKRGGGQRGIVDVQL